MAEPLRQPPQPPSRLTIAAIAVTGILASALVYFEAAPASARAGAVLLLTGLIAGLVSWMSKRPAEVARTAPDHTPASQASLSHRSTLLDAVPGMAFRYRS